MLFGLKNKEREINMQLVYRKNNANYEIPLYEEEPEELHTCVNVKSQIYYIRLVPVTDTKASHIRVRYNSNIYAMSL